MKIKFQDPVLHIAEICGSRMFYIPNLKRIWLYLDGIDRRISQLKKEYLLKQIELKDDDVVIDCGANIGELFYALCGSKKIRYIAIEPAPTEFHCLKHNVSKGEFYQVALGEKDGEADFYLKSDTADSSLIEPEGYDKRVSVQVKKLDTIYKEAKLGSVKLIKIEAEGFEPEVIKGGMACIANAEYVVVDAGPERGKLGKTTVHKVCNNLFEIGFKIVGYYDPRRTFLFKKN